MKKETRITAPEGCEIGKIEIVDGVAVVDSLLLCALVLVIYGIIVKL